MGLGFLAARLIPFLQTSSNVNKREACCRIYIDFFAVLAAFFATLATLALFAPVLGISSANAKLLNKSAGNIIIGLF